MVAEAILNEVQKKLLQFDPQNIKSLFALPQLPQKDQYITSGYKMYLHLRYFNIYPKSELVPACAAVWKQTSDIFIVGAQTRQGQTLHNRVFYLAYNNKKLLNHSLAESLTLKQAKEHEDGTS